MQNEKGCVYFFRHIGLTPVKIGYSQNESPINRFDQFKTYAPFGAELLGFIRTENAKDLETLIHQKFSYQRLAGEWFEISSDEVEKTIKFYSNIEDVYEVNNFQISWAKKLAEKNNEINAYENHEKLFFKRFSRKKTNEFTQRTILNYSEILEKIDIDKVLLKKIISKYDIKYQNHRINNGQKKGFDLYLKTE